MIKDLRLTTEFKALYQEGEMLKIEGMASTNSVDRDGDVILPSAWVLDDFLKNPILLANHRSADPIGKVTSIEVVDNGLKVVAEISRTADKIATMIEEGILKTFSVGFRLLDGEWKEDTDHFTITKADLHELSIVSIPANQDAVFSVAKSFDNDKEYTEFKKEFMKEEDLKDDSSITKAETSASIETDVSTNKTLEEQMSDLEKTKTTPVVEVKDSGTERLLAEIAKRLEGVEKREQDLKDAAVEKAASDKAQEYADIKSGAESMASALKDLQTEVAEKADEIRALNESKMSFTDKSGGGSISKTDTDSAVFMAKALGKRVEDTVFGKALLTKVPNSPHLAANTMADQWEEDYNTRVFDDIKNLLVIEPLFKAMAMSTPTMFLPINPEAGVAEWIRPAYYGSELGEVPGATSSTGTELIHGLKEQTLIAHKLAAKEFVSLEEQEDSIIALMPIIRDAVVRRMANASDIALLRGQAVANTDPITGLTLLASNDSKVIDVADQPSIAGADLVTVDMMGKMRQKLGQWGLNPDNVVYVVSTEAYFDLLQDPDFRTMDLVGDRATIITGQIGSIMGSPVIVSTSFEAKADTKVFAVAVNKANFMVGNFRNLTSERDYIVSDQRTVLVSTRRFGFMQTIAGNAVASGIYKT